MFAISKINQKNKQFLIKFKRTESKCIETLISALKNKYNK